MAFELTPERKAHFDRLAARYPQRPALAIPLLHLCQEQEGWVSPDVLAYVARTLEISTARVEGVATFYSQFQGKKPGRNVIWVCRTLSCELNGATEIKRTLEQKLGCKVGETSADGEFTLLPAECLAGCGQGPVLQVNDRYYERVAPAQIDEILQAARQGTHRGAIDFSPVVAPTAREGQK